MMAALSKLMVVTTANNLMVTTVKDLMVVTTVNNLVAEMLQVVINNAHQRDQLATAIVYIADMSHAITTNGIATTAQNTPIKSAVVKFLSTIKNSAAVMFHNITAKHVAVKFHNTTIHAHVTMCQSTLVNVAANMFQSIITNILANQHVHLILAQKHLANKRGVSFLE